MEKILLDELVESKWICPFNINTLEILLSNEESRDLIEKFYSLCDTVNYRFSSPGNSFERKLILILNRKYQLDRLNNPCLIRHECESNNEWLATYDNLIDAIRNDASKIKFRELKSGKLNFIKMTEKDILAKFRSDVLNNAGIIATYNTFINLEK